MSHSAQDYIGSYRLINLLRIGKTCQVWEVLHDARGTRYAIKLLLAEYRRDKEEIAFLRHEFSVGRQLDHPSVIKIHEFGIDRENVYLAMDLYQALNVKQILNQQGAEQFAPYLRSFIEQGAEGLGYFHSKGWIHRDIKPDNYLMKPGGETKLIDFALAVRERRGLGRLFSRRTKVQGTRSYMSPEQIRGQSLDRRADIYSFGCMIHELASGKPPFTGVSTNELLNKHLRSAVPGLQSANRNVTDQFAGLVRRMLAKDPSERPSTLEEFVREVRAMELFKVPPAIPKT